MLATRYGIPVEALAEANGIIDVDLIVAGKTLRIPPPARRAAIASSLSVALSRVERLYRDARFHDALAATGAQVFDSLDDPALRAQLELLRGKIQTAFGDSERAVRHFRTAVELAPELELPSPTSPKIAAHFQAARIAARR